MILRNFISLRAFSVYTENSLRFEMSLRSIWPKWNLHRSKFHYAQSHVNADNEVTSHRSEVLPQFYPKNLCWGWVYTFVKTAPEFFILLFYLWYFQTKQSSTPGYSTHLCYLDPLEIPRPKAKTHGNSTLFFLVTSTNSTRYFFDTPGNSISSTPLFVFFLE